MPWIWIALHLWLAPPPFVPVIQCNFTPRGPGLQFSTVQCVEFCDGEWKPLGACQKGEDPFP